MKRTAAFILFLALACQAFADQAPEPNIDSWSSMLRTGNYDDLVTATSEVIENGPRNIAWYYRGIARFRLGQYEAARSDLEMVSGEEGESGSVQHWLAEAYRATGLFDKALAAINKALGKSPTDSWMLYSRALIYENLGQYEAAITDIETASGFSPEEDFRSETMRLHYKAFGLRGLIRAFSTAADLKTLFIPPLLWIIGLIVSLLLFAYSSGKKGDNIAKYQEFMKWSRLINLPLLMIYIFLLSRFSVISEYGGILMIILEGRLIMYYLTVALLVSFSYYFFVFCSRTIAGYLSIKKWRNPDLKFGRQLKISSTFFIYIFMIQIAAFLHNYLIGSFQGTGFITFAVSAFVAAALVLLILVFYPRIIALFYGMDRALGKTLSGEYRNFMKECGLRVKKITVVKTSDIGMANAWVSGLGIYSIVVTDYLLKHFSKDEIKNVLSHETGHIKKGHLFFNYLLILFWLFSGGLISNYLSDSLIVYFAYAMMYFGFMVTFFSRRFEYQADNYAVSRTSQPEVFIGMLLKLGKKNWMPAFFRKAEEKTMTHPTIEKRIARIRQDFMPEQPAPEGI